MHAWEVDVQRDHAWVFTLCTLRDYISPKVFTAHHFVPIHAHTVYGLVCVLGQFSVQYTLSNYSVVSFLLDW